MFLFLWLSSDDVIKTLDICYQHPFRGGRSVLQSAMSNDTQNLARLDVVVVIDAINSLKKQMTEMNKRMVNMFQTLETKLNSISAGVDSLRADVAGLQALQPILLVQPSLIRRGDSPSKPSLHLLFLLDLQVQSR